MNATDWLVITGGAAIIAWVNWYFLLAQRSAVTAFAATAAVPGAIGSASEPGSTPETTE